MSRAKEKYTQPAQRFEDYVFKRITGNNEGLLPIDDKYFIDFEGESAYAFAGISFARNNSFYNENDYNVSMLTDIGFKFTFDGNEHAQIAATSLGGLILHDDDALFHTYYTNTSKDVHDFYTQILTQDYGFNSIHRIAPLNALSVYELKTAFLCPWLTQAGRVAAFDDTFFTSEYSAIVVDRLKHGLHTPLPLINATANGVKYYKGYSQTYGKLFACRWHLLSPGYASEAGGIPDATNTLHFEAVLYENGRIEFRYAPRSRFQRTDVVDGSNNQYEQACMGIFVPPLADDVPRFRDFSINIGHRDQERTPYVNGGYVYSSAYAETAYDPYDTDTFTASYSWQLRARLNWPGQTQFGATCVFDPPHRKRTILPRHTVRNEQSRKFDTRFDDKQVVNFVSGQIVGYPTTLSPSQFVNDVTANNVTKYDLFAVTSVDTLLTGAISKYAMGDLLCDEQIDEQRAFNDASDTSTDDAFFASSSFAQTNLRSLTQLTIELPIENGTILQERSASITYYNVKHKTFLLPRQTFSASYSMSDIYAGIYSTDVANVATFAGKDSVTEDHRGFGPIGNFVTSGSNDPSYARGTSKYINATYDSSVFIPAMTDEYSKSVTIDQRYNAVDGEETFKPNIDKPFLIEKAVIKLPLAAGPGWLSDKTTSFQSLETGNKSTFDFAGPAITVALFNQVGQEGQKRRDLILSGTITHEDDRCTDIEVSCFPPLSVHSYPFEIRPVGFDAYGAEPSCTVPNVNNTFTGSVTVQCEPLSTNGVVLKMIQWVSSSDDTTKQQALRDLFTAPLLSIASGSGTGLNNRGINLVSVSPFCRSFSGFVPAGRAMFGQEFALDQNVVMNNMARNPFYVSGSKLDALTSVINAITGSTFKAVTALPLLSHTRSPYLVMPGDDLVLAISKSRPFFYSTLLTQTSGSLQHDVQILTGSVRITLYGSYVANEQAIHDRKLQLSPVIHDNITDDIIDQFDTEYVSEYMNNVYDDYVTGSLVTKTTVNSVTVLSGGVRGRVFSKTNARTQTTPTSSGHETFVNPSKAFRLQPWYQRVGSVRVVAHVDPNERFYDTLLPGLNDVLNADGTNVWIPSTASYASSMNVDWSSSGYLITDYVSSPVTDTKLFDNTWNNAFPYTYRNRYQAVNTTAKYTYIAGAASGTPIKSQQLKNTFIGFSQPTTAGANIYVFADANLRNTNAFGKYVTGSMTDDDFRRVVYGFGDKNLRAASGSYVYGSNHAPDWKEQDLSPVHPTHENVYYVFKPEIRGWKYGIYNGLRETSKAYFRQNHYGHPRDMFEQRLDTKFSFDSRGIAAAAVQVSFYDMYGNKADPANTSSQNLSNEATSSMPYFDGMTVNR